MALSADPSEAPNYQKRHQDRRGAAILVWSGQLGAPGEASEPIGTVYVRWHDPIEEQATIWKLEWDPAEGGGEDEVWRAVEVLAGGPVAR